MYFDRKFYLEQLIRADGNGMIKIITGIRRCGKSYLYLIYFVIIYLIKALIQTIL